MMINEQLSFFSALTHTQREQENTERIIRPDEKIMCLFNGEYGEHTLDELNMSGKQMGKTLAL